VADPGGDIVEEHCYYQVKEGVYTFNLQNYPYGRFYLKVLSGDREIFNKRIRYVEPGD
jgi:hypothetical protein